MKRQGKVTISTTVSRLTDECIEKMVKSNKFSNRSNAVDSSAMLMFFVLNNEQIMGEARKMGITEP